MAAFSPNAGARWRMPELLWWTPAPGCSAQRVKDLLDTD